MFATSVSGTRTTITPEHRGMGTGQRAAVITFAAILVGVAVWGITACNRDGDPPPIESAIALASDARLITEDDLPALAEEVGHEVYWAGPQPDTQLEFTSDDTGNVHIRYLTEGTEAGEPSQAYLNIGTYPFEGAYKATRNWANQPPRVKVKEHGGTGFFDPGNPFSVIIAWPEHPNLQVEVYYPAEEKALDYVRSGDIVPVS